MITVYSASWCAFCHAAIEYLDKLGIKFEIKDIESDKAIADEAVKKSGQMGIPVIDIDGDIVVGFDRPKIDSLIASHGIKSEA